MWRIHMDDKTADALLCDLLAWNSCPAFCPGIVQPAVVGQTLRTRLLWLPTISLVLGTQCGTLIFAHSSQVLVTWMLMFTKGQVVSGTLASKSLVF